MVTPCPQNLAKSLQRLLQILLIPPLPSENIAIANAIAARQVYPLLSTPKLPSVILKGTILIKR
jgi:hypothetical protein